MRSPFILDNLVRDLRYAIRSLRKDLRFALVAVFALALGIGASTVVFSVFYNLMFNAFAARDADRLVMPLLQNTEMPEFTNQLWISWADVNYLREHNHVFENVVGSHSGIATAQYDARSYQFENGHVWPDAFEFYGVAPLLGRGIVAEDGKPGAPGVFMMSYRAWKGEFAGDPAIVGRKFLIEGEPRTLVGVMPKRFHGFGMTQELWTPISTMHGGGEGEKNARFSVLARVKRGVTLEVASAELELILKHMAVEHPSDDDYPKKFTARVVAVNDYLMQGPYAGTVYVLNSKAEPKSILYDLLGAVLVLLLIACSNVANLLLARATAREREIALRSALGGSRWQIVRQLLMESLVLALGACAAGSAVAWAAMKAVDTAIHQGAWARMSAEAVIGLNMPVLIFTAAITVLTTLSCGLVPALRATKRDLQPQLVGSGKGATAQTLHGRLRAALVVGQVALSIVLLVGAGLMMRSLHKLTHIDLGFNPKNILVAGFAPSRKGEQIPDREMLLSAEGNARFARAAEKIRELPGVASISVNNAGFPGYGPSKGPRVGVPGQTRDVEAGLDECDENYLDTLEMRMIAGRWLSRAEVETREYSAVINERLAQALFGDGNPVGKQFEARGFKRTFNHSRANLPENALFEIVGVVADSKNSGPQSPVVPMAFIPPIMTGKFLVQIRTRVEPGSLMHSVQQAVWDTDPGEVFWVLDSLEQFLQEHTYALPEFGVSLSAPLAGIALLLVVIGVFSVMAYTVSLQTQEIGVRMALGAQQRQVLTMVLRRGFLLIAVGLAAGVLASCALTRLLASQIWGVSPTDPWTFGAVVFLVVATGLAACYLPARRASQVDPLVALRYE